MKTLKEYLIDTYKTSDNEGLFEILEETSEVVLEDDFEEHRWYFTYRVVVEVEIDSVKRYFSWYDVKMKNENSTRDDVGWCVPDIDTEIKEVYCKEITVTTYE